MKSIVGVLLCVFVATHGAAIDDSPAPLIIPSSLFENALDYQNKLTALQQDINEQLTAIRTAVSTVLKSSSSETLAQIESNANKILEQDAPARFAIFELKPSACVSNLRILLNGATEFTGFGSSNCVTTYDINLQGALNTAYALLQKYEGSFGDVQQIVVRSFIGLNIFTQPEEVEARFSEQYNRRLRDWNLARPEVEQFVNTLSANIAVFNSVLGGCFTTLQNSVAPVYDILQGEIETCRDFDSTPDPFAIFRQ